MVRDILGPDLQAELAVMDETGVKGPVLALAADKFSSLRNKTKKAAGQEEEVVFVLLFYKKKKTKPNQRTNQNPPALLWQEGWFLWL